MFVGAVKYPIKTPRGDAQELSSLLPAPVTCQGVFLCSGDLLVDKENSAFRLSANFSCIWACFAAKGGGGPISQTNLLPWNSQFRFSAEMASRTIQVKLQVKTSDFLTGEKYTKSRALLKQVLQKFYEI